MWPNQATPSSNGENASENPTRAPSMSFSRPPTNSSFDPGQLQYQHMQQLRMPNGKTHQNPPSTQSPMYTTQNVVPSKRNRPREGSIGALSQSHPSGSPASPSQAPQGTYQGFPGVVHRGPQFGDSAPYQHFRPQKNEFKQPPVTQPQDFSSQGPNHAAHRSSPAPFSPAAQGFGTPATMPHSEPTNRADMAQRNGQMYPVNGNNQARSQPTAITADHMPTPPFANSQIPNPQRHGLHVAGRPRQTQETHAHAQSQEISVKQGQPNSLSTPPSHHVNSIKHHPMTQMQQRAHPALNGSQAQARPNNLDRLLRSMIQYMQSKRLYFNPRPVIAGKSADCVHIFILGMKLGGSRKIQRLAQWSQIARSLSFPQSKLTVAGQEIHVYWDKNLMQWERHFMHQQKLKSSRQRYQKGRSKDKMSKTKSQDTFEKNVIKRFFSTEVYRKDCQEEDKYLAPQDDGIGEKKPFHR